MNWRRLVCMVRGHKGTYFELIEPRIAHRRTKKDPSCFCVTPIEPGRTESLCAYCHTRRAPTRFWPWRWSKAVIDRWFRN